MNANTNSNQGESSQDGQSSSSHNNQIFIIKKGWLDKEIVNGYILFAKYSRRFLVLTPTFIRYYHRDITEVAEQQAKKVISFTEVPLSLLNEQSLLAGAHTEIDMIHIDHTGTGKMYRFRAQSPEVAMQWRMAIISTRTKLNPSIKVHFDGADNFKDEGTQEQRIIAKASTWRKHNDLVREFEKAAFSNVDRAKYVADAFFDALGKMSSKDRSPRAKEMGKSLVAWMEDDSAKTLEERLTSLKSEVLVIWLRVALSREFLNSCKYDETAGIDDDALSDSSNMTHSTIKSRMRNAKRGGSTIMPFRADTAESLFISAIFHSSCAKSNTLYFILHPVLRKVSINTDNYVYPKAVLVPPPVNQTNDIPPEEIASNPISSDEKTNNRNSLSRRSRNFFGLMRNSINLNRFATRNRSNSKDSNEPGSRPQSLDGRSLSNTANNFYGNSDGKQEQDARRLALAELSLLTPIELKRLEVRKSLLEIAASLVEKLRDCCTSPYLPLPITLMMKTMRDLIITEKENSARNSLDGDAINPSLETGSEEESDTSKSKKRFEYGTYFTSCSAMLFLRLICRAIISPDEYGVTEKVQPTLLERIASKDSFEWPSSGFAAMTILSHTLFHDEGDDHSVKNESANAVHSKKEHMTSAEVQELRDLVTKFSNQVPMNDASLYLELYHFKRPSTVLRSPGTFRSHFLSLGKSEDNSNYQFDWSKPSTRWALAEVAKSMQHIANISCLPNDEMQPFARDSLLRQNIAAGFQDKESYDTHVFTGLESETIAAQIAIASNIKEVYEKLGDLPPGKW